MKINVGSYIDIYWICCCICSYFNRVTLYRKKDARNRIWCGLQHDEAAHRMSPYVTMCHHVNAVAETLGGGDLLLRTVFCSVIDFSYPKHVHTTEVASPLGTSFSSFWLGRSVSASCTVSTGVCLVQVSLCSLLLICCCLLLFLLCTDSQRCLGQTLSDEQQ